MTEVYTKSDPKSCSQHSRNFGAEPFGRKFGTNFSAFWTFFARMRQI